MKYQTLVKLLSLFNVRSPNIFFGTSIPTTILVLRHDRENSDVLIVDASRGFAKDGEKQ